MFRSHSICIQQKLISLDSPMIMGILNITPDSFFPDSRVSSTDQALETANKMLKEGADILDIGGYSSRPGAEEISEEEEKNRVIPIIEAISSSFPHAILSIDSFRSSVAKEAIAAGAHIINDISGGDGDSKMFSTVKNLNVPYILMHMQGTPQTMQNQPSYENVTQEVFKSLSLKITQLRKIGVNDIIIDPGFGFGKTSEHNYQLLQQLEYFHSLNCPLLVGISRKSMIYRELEISANDSLNGTTVLNTIAIQKGASFLRVHDVKEAKEIILLTRKTTS